MASGELLNMLQKSARNGTLLSSCEPEVTELMHQLDVLISEHQREWEGKMKETYSQLRLREKELTSLRMSLQERTNQLERARLENAQVDREHRARHADCEAQLVRVRAELSRLRHSYEQLRAKRSQQSQQKSAVSNSCSCSHGTVKYRQECHSLRQQLSKVKEKLRELERECQELKERLKKRDEDMEGLVVERRQSQHCMAYLQETLKSKEDIIRDLEGRVGLKEMSTRSQTELENMQEKVSTLMEAERRLNEELRTRSDMEKRLRDELARTEKERDKWKRQLDEVKVHQNRRESAVVQRLEERVHKLEHQLRESQQRSAEGGAPRNEAIGQFEEEAERLIHGTPVGVTSSSATGYVSLEPLQPHLHSTSREGEGRGVKNEQWSQLLEKVLGKHFDQLDSSLQKILTPS